MIKRFNEFIKEAVIMPRELGGVEFRSYDDLKNYCDENGIDLVNYNEFYNSLSDRDKETAPPDDPRIPFFALYHRERDKPMFVLKDQRIVQAPFFKSAFFEIIGHEFVHSGQHDRRELKFALPNPEMKKEYFSDKDEIMAFSWSVANELFKTTDSFEEAENRLRKGKIIKSHAMPSPTERMWHDIQQSVDKKVLNKYHKYIYMYLQKMYKVEDNEPTNSVQNYKNFLKKNEFIFTEKG